MQDDGPGAAAVAFPGVALRRRAFRIISAIRLGFPEKGGQETHGSAAGSRTDAGSAGRQEGTSAHSYRPTHTNHERTNDLADRDSFLALETTSS